ncbi:MAG TPA: hypothetical protein VFD04_18755 [Actinomycetes bacterium]|nr:hypothetical protein [Actinomycetes bacterium]
MLLTGPFGGLTEDVREFLWCLAGQELPLTGWGELDPSGLRLVREWLPGGLALGDGPEGMLLARRRTSLLRALCDAGSLVEATDGQLRLTALGWEFLGLPPAAQLGFVFAAWWEGVDWGRWAPRAELGRLLWYERDVLVHELAAAPAGRVVLAGFARRLRRLVGHRWPGPVATASVADWERALWATALAPLAMLGAVDAPAPGELPIPPWFELTDAAPALLAAAAAMSGEVTLPGASAN